MNLLFTIDRGYMEHVEDCIGSILRFPSEDGYDIYIMHSDLTEEDKAQISRHIADKRARLHFIYVDRDMFEVFPESDRYPRLIYYRIFAAQLLPKDLDRILYLDGDTIVINSLEELYEMDFDGNYFLACTHVKKLMNKINQCRLGAEEVPYINSGVMLMNLQALRENVDEERVIQFVLNKKNVLVLPDQDVISALYGDKVKIIDTMKYNLSDRMLYLHNSDIRNKKIDLQWVRENAVVIHYYGKQKPWNKTYFGILNIFYVELKKGETA